MGGMNQMGNMGGMNQMGGMGGMPAMGGMNGMGGMSQMGGMNQMGNMGGMPAMGGMGGMPAMGGMNGMGGMSGMNGMGGMSQMYSNMGGMASAQTENDWEELWSFSKKYPLGLKNCLQKLYSIHPRDTERVLSHQPEAEAKAKFRAFQISPRDVLEEMKKTKATVDNTGIALANPFEFHSQHQVLMVSCSREIPISGPFTLSKVINAIEGTH